jgi:hypothetical protein
VIYVLEERASEHVQWSFFTLDIMTFFQQQKRGLCDTFSDDTSISNILEYQHGLRETTFM